MQRFKFPFVFLKGLCIYSGFWFCGLHIFSQNLVPNYSFEEQINFDIPGTLGWHKVQLSDTPDYFNLDEGSPSNDIFKSYIGNVSAKSGSGFTGIFCYRINPNRRINNIREFIETPLISNLEKDSLYTVKISLYLDEESNISIKNFGIFFSNQQCQYLKEFKSFKIKPQVAFNSVFISDSSKWTTLEAVYKAGGFEKYICIGNFLPDKSTSCKKIIPIRNKRKMEKWNLAKNELASYYYIDDVIIEKIPCLKTGSLIGPDTAETVFNLENIKPDSAIILKNVIFEFNQSDLLPQSYTELIRLFNFMYTYPEIRVKLEGHTDNIGEFDFNLNLSNERVRSVADYLINKGIDPSRIECKGYSYSYPLESNETEEGRSVNRRVTFTIIQK